MIKRALLIGAIALAAPAAGFAQSKMAMPAAAAMPAPATADYVKMAGQSDIFEVQSGQMAEKMAKSPALKKFGAQMVVDHKKSTDMVMTAAKKSGMSPSPPPLKPEQQAMLDELKGKTGAGFDQAYIKQQMAAHQEALNLQSSYAAGGADANLKAAAGKIVPVVKMHMSMLSKMAGA